MPARGEKIVAMEALGAVTIRMADGLIRTNTLGSERFAPSRFLAISVVYGVLGGVAGLGDAWADLASAFGGLVVLGILLSSVPTGNGGNVGSELANAIGKLKPTT